MANAEWGVLIADDDLASRRNLRGMLAEFPDFHVVGECRDGAEVLAQLEVTQPHVVFLGIQMPGVSDFELVKPRAPEQVPAVVLLTAYDEFAIRDYDAQALDYLVKPVSVGRFAATIARLRQQLASDAPAEQPSGVTVSTTRGSTVIRFDEIDWIEANENFARMWIGTRSHVVRESLSALEVRAVAHGFLRASKSALVRLQAVRTITRTADGKATATLTSGGRVELSPGQRAEFARAVKTLR